MSLSIHGRLYSAFPEFKHSLSCVNTVWENDTRIVIGKKIFKLISLVFLIISN